MSNKPHIKIATIKGIWEEGNNTAQCKTCIFGPKPLELGETRMLEIITYLANGTRHICHTTNKTCFGALEFQSKVFFEMKIIQEPTVECLIKTAAQFKEGN